MTASVDHAPVLRRHREAAVRTLLPATTERSPVWQSYVERGDTSDHRLRDVHRVAQLSADAEAGMLLPLDLRPKFVDPAPTPVHGGGLTTTAFMTPKK